MIVHSVCTDVPNVIDPEETASVQVGFTTTAWSVHALVQVYPAGTHAVPSHCSFAIELANHPGKFAILCWVSTTPSPQ
ncbi:MAG: hypothetical protein WCL02_02535 [bacterium]